MKAQLIAKLLWRYEGLLKEITAQKANYPTQAEYLTAWLKYAQRVNYLHAAQFRTIK